jgi:hypothetical protein
LVRAFCALVIEGVTAIFALAEWLQHNEGKPCDVVVALWSPRVNINYAQANMLRYLKGQFDVIEDELKRRGIAVFVPRAIRDCYSSKGD